MALHRVRTLQALLMCLMMVLSVQSMGLGALLSSDASAASSSESDGPGSSHEFGGGTDALSPFATGSPREESVIDTWHVGDNLTEDTNLTFGPVGAVSPTGMRHLCWIDDLGQVHHGRLGEDNVWTDDVGANWSTSVVTTVENATDNPVCAVAATTDDRARIIVRDGENLTAAREAFPNSMYLNQVWHVRTFMLDVNASSISLVLHEDREHAGVVDGDGHLWLVWNEGVLWNRTLVDAGPVAGEVEMRSVNAAVEIYAVVGDELLRWQRVDDEFKRSVVAENPDLSTAIGVDHDRNGVAQVATAVNASEGPSVELIRSLVGQREGRVSGDVASTIALGDNHTAVGQSVHGDLDGDGRSDAVFGLPSSNQAHVAFGNGTSLLINGTGMFGHGVALADIDGDGLDDLLIGAPGDDATNGTLSAWFSSVGAPHDRAPDWTMNGSSGEGLGHRLVTIADLDGDGDHEVGVSSLSSTTTGAVHVLFGNGTGLDLKRSILPTSTGPAFGQSLASGDLNCDGVADLVASNTGTIDSPTGYSAIEVFHGSASGYNGTPDRTFVSNAQGRLLGHALLVMPDVTGDGCDDLLVSEPLNGTSAYNAGRLWLWAGASPRMAEAPAWVLDGTSNARLGLALTAAGDIDGDGQPDLLVSGAGTGANPGDLALHFGNGAGFAADTQMLVTGASGDHAAERVLAQLDLDGDGLEEIAASRRGLPVDGGTHALSIEVRERVDWQSLSFPMDTLPSDIMLSTALRGETAMHVVTADPAGGNQVHLIEHTLDGTPGGQWVTSYLAGGGHLHTVAALPNDVGPASLAFHQVLNSTHSIGQLNAYGVVAYEGPVLTTGAWGEHLATVHKEGLQHFVLPSEGDGRLWHTVEKASGWDTGLISAGVTLDAPAALVALPDNASLAALYVPSGGTDLHAAWGSGAVGGTWTLSTLDLGTDVVGASVAATYDEGLVLWALTSNGSAANLSQITVSSTGEATLNATFASDLHPDGTITYVGADQEGHHVVVYTSPDSGHLFHNGTEVTAVGDGASSRDFRPAAWGSLSAPLVSGHHGSLAVRWSSTLGFLHHVTAEGVTETPLASSLLGDGGAFDYDGDLWTSSQDGLQMHADLIDGDGLPFENASRVRSITFSGLAADAQVHPTEGYTGTDPHDDDHRYRSLTAVDAVSKDVHLIRLVLDEDRDFVPNAHDDLPYVSGQWEDADGDGFGDLATGPFPDACPSNAGTSYLGQHGCLDSDDDGWDDITDDCPIRGTSWFDRQGCEDNDQDGWSTNSGSWTKGDSFILNWKQALDSDGDGRGDNSGPDCCNTALDNQEPDLFPYNARQYKDTDGDGWGDDKTDELTGDECPYDYGTSFRDRRGCEDRDGDGSSDPRPPEDFPYNWSVEEGADLWPDDPTQWVDSDGDGYGDNSSEGATNPDHFPALIFAAVDDDRDGVPDEWTSFYDELNGSAGLNLDGCLNAYGNSTTGLGEDEQGNAVQIPLYGCPDTDGDGRANQDDAFPLESTQTTDTDGDGFGDNIGGVDGDECYLVPGVADGTPTFAGGTGRGCPMFNDIDGDGVGDDDDACPSTDAGASVDAVGCALNQLDSDNDSINDAEDRCPNTVDFRTIDAYGCDTQQQNVDSDEDGVNDADDLCPLTPMGEVPDTNGCAASQRDSDNDGVNDDVDVCPASKAGFPVDATGCLDETACEDDLDADGVAGCPAWEIDTDGLRVNQIGDAFPLEETQWNDTDGDGYGDNLDGFEGDACPTEAGTSLRSLANNVDRFGCPDDGDGFVDEPFPEDATQWLDADQDGFGDNATGTNPDLCPDTAPGDRNRVDTNGCAPIQRDTDNDGVNDEFDQCPTTPLGENGFADGCPAADAGSDGEAIELFGQPLMVVVGGGAGGLFGLLLLLVVLRRVLRSSDDDDEDDDDDWFDDEEDEAPARTPMRRREPTALPSTARAEPSPRQAAKPAGPSGGPPRAKAGGGPPQGGPPGRKGPPGGGPPGRKAPSQGGPPGRAQASPPVASRKPVSEPSAPKKAGRRRVEADTVSEEANTGGPTRRRAKVNVDLSMFEDSQTADRNAAVAWVVDELGAGGVERTILMQLQSTGWSAEQSRAILDLAAAGRSGRD